MRPAFAIALVLFAPVAGADHAEALRVVDVTVDPATLAEGTVPTLAVTVENVGATSLAAFEGDCTLGFREAIGTVVPGLAPGQRAAFTCTGEALPPRVSEFVAYVSARDTTSYHRVLAASMHTFPVELAGAPSLEVAGWSIEPETPVVGDLVKIRAVILNLGDSEARGVLARLTLGARHLVQESGPIPPGANTTLTGQWRALPGRYDIVLTVDASSDPSDPSFTRTRTLEVARRPIPAEPAGAELSVVEANWTRYRGHAPFDSLALLVANRGTVASPGFSVLYAQAGQEENGQALGIDPLRPGEDRWVHFPRIATAPRIVVVLDAYDEVAELDETDNRIVPEPREVPWSTPLFALLAMACAAVGKRR